MEMGSKQFKINSVSPQLGSAEYDYNGFPSNEIQGFLLGEATEKRKVKLLTPVTETRSRLFSRSV